MSTDTLTERYVREVVRRIPADQREDVANELRTTIADTVDARSADSPEAAEREVLTEMGDPIRLAAGYADRPLALIGPELYPAYIRLLVLLLSTVLPLVTAGMALLEVLDGGDVGDAIGAGIGALLATGAQIIAWLTVVFAFIERVAPRADLARRSAEWNPDKLPELKKPDKGGPGAYASAVWHTLLIGLIVWQHIAQPYRADGERLEILDPALWSGWIWPILAGLAGIATIEVIRSAVRGWTIPLAAWYAAAHALFALPLAWIFYTQQVFNPPFLTSFNGDWTTPDVFYNVVAVGVILLSINDVIKPFRQARH